MARKKRPLIPHDYTGMYVLVDYKPDGTPVRKGQYWSFGGGYYREFPGGTVVFKDGKKVGKLPEFYKKLKEFLNNTDPADCNCQLNLFKEEVLCGN